RLVSDWSSDVCSSDLPQQERADRCARHHPHGTALVCPVAGVAEGDLERQDADERVDDAARGEPGPRQPVHVAAVGGLTTGELGLSGLMPGCWCDHVTS